MARTSSRNSRASRPTPSRPASFPLHRSPVLGPDTLTSPSRSRARPAYTLDGLPGLKRKGGQSWCRQRGGQRHRPRVLPRHLPARRAGVAVAHHALTNIRSTSRCSRCCSAGSATCPAANGGRIVGAAEPSFRLMHRLNPHRRERSPRRAPLRRGDHMFFFIGRVRGWPGGQGRRAELRDLLLHAELPCGRAQARSARAHQPRCPAWVFIPSDDLIAKNI